MIKDLSPLFRINWEFVLVACHVMGLNHYWLLKTKSSMFNLYMWAVIMNAIMLKFYCMKKSVYWCKVLHEISAKYLNGVDRQTWACSYSRGMILSFLYAFEVLNEYNDYLSTQFYCKMTKVTNFYLSHSGILFSRKTLTKERNVKCIFFQQLLSFETKAQISNASSHGCWLLSTVH